MYVTPNVPTNSFVIDMEISRTHFVIKIQEYSLNGWFTFEAWTQIDRVPSKKTHTSCFYSASTEQFVLVICSKLCLFRVSQLLIQNKTHTCLKSILITNLGVFRKLLTIFWRFSSWWIQYLPENTVLHWDWPTKPYRFFTMVSSRRIPVLFH
jgi:hypothetical protein